MILSVILPVYNAEDFLHDSIQSILNQTFVDFELIIINDGSKDKSLEIINSFRDPRIVVVNQLNKGLAKSLNVGLELSKGRYIARMDADDIALPSKFEKQIKYLKHHPHVKLLGTAVELIDEKGQSLCIDTPFVGSDFLKKYMQKIGNPFKHPTVIFDKSIALKCGGFNELIGKYFEDYFLWNRIAKEYDVENLDEALLKYRITPGSIMGSIKSKEFSEFILNILRKDEFTEGDRDRMLEIKQREHGSMGDGDNKLLKYQARIKIIKKKKTNILFNFLLVVLGEKCAMQIMIKINQMRYSRLLNSN